MPRQSTTLTLGPRPGAEPGHGSVLFVGNATLVVELGPFTLLTDPNFLRAGEPANLGAGTIVPRLTDPALELEALPPLDACVLSGLHGDHWDHVATAGLSRDLPVLTTPQAARELRHLGFGQALALEPWDEAVLRRGPDWLRVTAVPGQHGPPVLRLVLPKVMGSVWELGRGGGEPHFRMYVSGDTRATEDLREIAERFPGLDLAVVHLGGAHLLGLRVTMDASEGVAALRMLEPAAAIPVHFDDYAAFKSPLDDFGQAVAEAGLAQRVKFLTRGERHALTFRGFPRVVPAPLPTGAGAQPGREGEGHGADWGPGGRSA